MSTITFPQELEAELANAVALGRMYLVNKQRYDDVKRLDEAINKYKQLKTNNL